MTGCITVYCFSLCRGDRITNAALPLAVTSGRPTNEKPGPAFCRLLCQTGLFVCVKIPGEFVNGGRTVGEAYSRIIMLIGEGGLTVRGPSGLGAMCYRAPMLSSISTWSPRKERRLPEEQFLFKETPTQQPPKSLERFIR